MQNFELIYNHYMPFHFNNCKHITSENFQWYKASILALTICLFLSPNKTVSSGTTRKIFHGYSVMARLLNILEKGMGGKVIKMGRRGHGWNLNQNQEFNLCIY